MAAGVYRVPGPTRAESFVINSGTRVYGGFAGGESDLNERPADLFAQPSILTGDRLGNDSQTPIVNDVSTVTGQEDNAYNVVRLNFADTSSILDGFVITGGRGRPSTTGQVATDGGGLYLNESHGEVRNLRILGNRVEGQGGGIHSLNSVLELSDVTVMGNSAGGDGGGLAAMGSSLQIERVEIHANLAGNDGGGIKMDAGTLFLDRVSIRGNHSFVDGGGAALLSGAFVAHNSLFAGNLASPLIPTIGPGNGGGLFAHGGAACQLVNCTVAGNRANANAGSIFAGNDTGVDIYNTIIWDNLGSFDIYPEPEVDHIRIRRSLTYSILAFTSPIDWADSMWDPPQFVAPIDPAAAPTLAGNLRLQPTSPALEAGTNIVVLFPLDLDSSTRIFDANSDGTAWVDIGAYEYQPLLPPSPPELSKHNVNENQPVGTVVGLLSAADPNPTDTVTFSLTSGTGDDDNAAFTIVGGELRTAVIFDFETKSHYSILVRATDSTGLTTDLAFLINVINLGEAPPVAVDDQFSNSLFPFPRQDIFGNVIEGSDLPDSDPDGVALTVSAVNGNPAAVNNQITLASGAFLTLNSDGSFAYLGNNKFLYLRAGESANDSFHYTITDGNANFASATVTLVNRGFNDPPQAQDDVVERVARSPFKIRVSKLLQNDSDPDGDVLKIVFNLNDNPFAGDSLFPGTSQRGATLTISDGWIYYTFSNPANDTGAPDTFTYFVKDPGNRFAAATVTVNTVNQPFLLRMIASPNITYNSGANTTSITSSFIGVPGRSYSVEATSDVGDSASWNPVNVFVADLLGNFIVIENALPGNVSQRFYRASF